MSQPTGGRYFLLTGLLIGASAVAPGQSTKDRAPARSVTSDQEVATAIALTRSRPSALAWSRLGDAYMQKARETFDLSYYGRAESAYQKAVELNPKYADAPAGMAWVQSARHEFEQSIDWANRALAIQPDRADAYGLLGDAAVEMGDYEKAFDHYQKMLDLRPDISSLSRSAHLLFLTGDVQKASLLMNKAIGYGGPYAENTAWCRAQLALMEIAVGAYLPASQLVADGLEKVPNNYHLLAARGKVRAALRDYAGAVESYKRAEAVVPQHEVAVALGDLYTLEGKRQEAEAQYSLVEAIRKLNQANGVVGDLQWAQFSADHDRNLPEALRLAEAEYKTRPNVYAADVLAWCYFKNGRLAEAKQSIARALSKRTPEARFLYHQGVICVKAGDAAEAKKALYQALSLNPNFHPLEAQAATRLINELGSAPVASR